MLAKYYTTTQALAMATTARRRDDLPLNPLAAYRRRASPSRWGPRRLAGAVVIAHCRRARASIAVALLAACVGPPVAPDPGVGPQPKLPPPQSRSGADGQRCDRSGLARGTAPTAAPGLAVKAFAPGLDHPRWVYALPNGDVLVAETNAPPQAGRRQGLQGQGDGLLHEEGRGEDAERQPHHAPARRRRRRRRGNAHGVHEGLNSPFGMALVGDVLYIANTDAVVSVPYSEGDTRIAEAPGQGRRPARPARATITGRRISSRAATGASCTRPSARTATSPRTAWPRKRIARPSSRSTPPPAQAGCSRPACAIPNGLGWHPESGALWTVVNERDELGNNLVPDYLTSVKRERVLRLAVQLLRRQRRHAGVAAAAGSRGAARGAGLCARLARRAARPRVLRSARSCRSASAAARSSASTARGIARRNPATRWCSFPSPTAGRQGCPKMS